MGARAMQVYAPPKSFLYLFPYRKTSCKLSRFLSDHNSIAVWGFAGAMSANILNMVGVGPFLTIPLGGGCDGRTPGDAWLDRRSIAVSVRWHGVGGAGFCVAALRRPLPLFAASLRSHGLGTAVQFSVLVGIIADRANFNCIGRGGLWRICRFSRATPPASGTRRDRDGVCVLNTGLLYRNIRSVSKISIITTSAVLGTCAWIVISGAMHFHAATAFSFPAHAFEPSTCILARTGFGDAHRHL